MALQFTVQNQMCGITVHATNSDYRGSDFSISFQLNIFASKFSMIRHNNQRAVTSRTDFFDFVNFFPLVRFTYIELSDITYCSRR